MSTVSSPRIRPKEIMAPKELEEFMTLHGFTQQELADVLGVGVLAVRTWRLGERQISTPITRLIRMFKKYPALLKEF